MKEGNPHIKQSACQQNGSKHGVPLFSNRQTNSSLSQTKFSLTSSQHDSAAFSAQSSDKNSITGDNHGPTTNTNVTHASPLTNGVTTTTVFIDNGTQCDNNNVAVVIEHFKPLSNGISHKTVKSLNGKGPSAGMQKVLINLDDLSTATAV